MSEKSFRSVSSVSSRKSRKAEKKAEKKKLLSSESSSHSIELRASASDFFSPVHSPIESAMGSEEKMENLEKGLSGLRDAGTSNIHKTIIEFLTTHKDTLEDWVNHTIAFAGFNAEIMRANVLKKAPLDAITLLCLVGLVRGNNIERIKTTMKSKEITKKFSNAVSTLKVKKSVSGDFDAVTLSRLIACFPDIVLNFLHTSKLPMAVDYSELLFIHQEFPLVARHQVCASILMANDPRQIHQCLDVIMVPYIKTSEVINGKNKEWLKKTKAERITESSRYLLNSYHSKLFSAKERTVFCTYYKITVGDQLSTIWRDAAAASKEFLKKTYDFSFTDL